MKGFIEITRRGRKRLIAVSEITCITENKRGLTIIFVKSSCGGFNSLFDGNYCYSDETYEAVCAKLKEV